jgi:thiol:disulfide interchange protein
MKPASIFSIIAVLVLAGAAVLYNQLSTQSAIDQTITLTNSNNEIQPDNRPDSTAGAPSVDGIPPAEVAFETNTYVDYSPTTQAAAQQQGTTVLFFAATEWCQTCSALEAEILEKSDQIPAQVTILKVDYDNDSAMKSRYGVTTQHTLIVLDKSGSEVKRWVGGDFARMLRGIEEV